MDVWGLLYGNFCFQSLMRSCCICCIKLTCLKLQKKEFNFLCLIGLFMLCLCSYKHLLFLSYTLFVTSSFNLVILLWQERLLSRLPATAVLVTNAIMFAKPLQALAETCEADNSVFNMNMPLLLFVALVGATVGGKFQLIL